MDLLQQILFNDGYHIADCQFGEIRHMYELFHVYHVVRKACWTAAFGSLYQLPYTGSWLLLDEAKRSMLCGPHCHSTSFIELQQSLNQLLC
ncbi:hypothetical protein AX774_g349 [Zancudomyces culisetae]|uniref:Uncharacterized protein n=1 Tax=Zancudomyces culisetae TaxID=1213189 RepID=A0A1R1PYS6_ZANCU|nr:hypothetical protein AX774_g349 [Zancudomyces culisetae]|eukprot:OMH86118.1 hypothetical protein AX774_g349 [Zancudomyces culisetae]